MKPVVRKCILRDDEPRRGPWEWSLQERLDYAMGRIEKTMDLNPGIAEIWLREVNTLRARLDAQEASAPIDTTELTEIGRTQIVDPSAR